MYPYIFVSALGSYQMGRHKLSIIIIISLDGVCLTSKSGLFLSRTESMHGEFASGLCIM